MFLMCSIIEKWFGIEDMKFGDFVDLVWIVWIEEELVMLEVV